MKYQNSNFFATSSTVRFISVMWHNPQELLEIGKHFWKESQHKWQRPK